MPAIAMGVLWAGYTLTLWGYCLVRGYDVTLRQLVDPVHPLTWGQFPTVPQGQVLPSGSAATTGSPSPPKPKPKGTGTGGGGGGGAKLRN